MAISLTCMMHVGPKVEYAGVSDDVAVDLEIRIRVNKEVNYFDEDSGPNINDEGEKNVQSIGHKFLQFRATVDVKSPHFTMRLTFGCKQEFKEAFSNHAISNGKEIIYEKNENIRMITICKHRSCHWKLH